MVFMKEIYPIFSLLLMCSARKFERRSAVENGSVESDAIFQSNSLLDPKGSNLQKRDKVGQYGSISTPSFQRIPQNNLPFSPVDNSLIDFSQATLDQASGKLCVTRFESVNSIEKDPILECDHKEHRSCHFTYVTQFQATQEEVCDENFEKVCQIVFKKAAFNETVRKCYTPVDLECDEKSSQQSSYGAPKPARRPQSRPSDDAVICRTVKETLCTTRYVKKGGKLVGDTSCKSIPVELCGGSTCKTRNLPEECHDKVVASIVDIPEETCDLNPQEVCRLQTKLIPKLTPIEECKTHPREVCQMKFTEARSKKKPITIKYCLMNNNQRPTSPGIITNSYPNRAPSNSYGGPVVQSPSSSYGGPVQSSSNTFVKPIQTYKPAASSQGPVAIQPGKVYYKPSNVL
ncbi:hypothetical protein TCAL_12657 [Tigriopus californicus]|uniref:Uncharacterized protein n=2 Tax=Tigriopus californicus TaxID=6832 RepID=A0A553PDT3_TIGCA|nr:hypothetical protein TCAL_12657 [Tigriopus californicus]